MRTRRLVILFAFAVAAFSSFGCTSWRKQDTSVERLLAEKPDIQLCIAVEGRKIPLELFLMRVAADTLYGWGRYLRDPESKPSPLDWDYRYRKKPVADSVAIPISAIRSVEEKRFSAGKTVFSVLGLAAFALLFAVIATGNMWAGF